jgi:hypothetical protein
MYVVDFVERAHGDLSTFDQQLPNLEVAFKGRARLKELKIPVCENLFEETAKLRADVRAVHEEMTTDFYRANVRTDPFAARMEVRAFANFL